MGGVHERASASVRLEQRLAAARAPQLDIEARRLKARAKAALFGGERRTSVGRYEIGEVLGRGGAGVVHRAIDPELDRSIAIKLVHAEEAAVDVLREARAIAALSHPNIVEVYDTGHLGDEVYIAMELVDGASLEAWCRCDRTWPELRDALVQAGRGLAHAHAAGIVHGDFKPSNVIVGADGRVRVVDFGLAQFVHVDPPQRDGFAGTPAYMAPEQLRGHPADERSDQFAFCVVAFEAVYGRRPFSGRTLAQLLERVEAGTIVVPRRRGLAPARVERAIRRGLSRRPDARWPSMSRLLAELERSPPSRGRWAVRALVGIGALVLAYALASPDPQPACVDARSEMASAWGPARAAEVESALASMPSIERAAGHWSRVEAELEAYGHRWSVAYAGVCAAPAAADDPRFEQRLRCLRHRLVALRAFVDVLAAGKPRAIATATEAVQALPAIETCVQDVALENAFPRATHPSDVAVVARIETRLAEAASWSAVGQHERAIDPLREAVADAELVGSRAHAARALHALAGATRGTGDFEVAAERAMEAFWHAMASDSDAAAIDAAVLLVAILGHDLGRFEDAQRWARQARALLPRASDPTAAEVALELALAQSAMAAQQHERAVDHLRHALALAGESPRVGILHLNLAAALGEGGAHEEALEHQRRASEALVSELGALHPEVVNARAVLGGMLASLGHGEEAMHELEESIDVAEAIGMADHPMVGMAYSNLGLVQVEVGQHDEARANLERALAIVSSTMPPTHPYVGMIHGNLAELAAERGDAAVARDHLGRAAVILGEALGAESPVVAKLAKIRGDVERRAGNAEVAIESYEEAIALLRDVPAYDDTRIAAELALTELTRSPTARR